jgi:hypothetical protein
VRGFTGDSAQRIRLRDLHEADDGDAGAADVIAFKVGDHVFVACDHGESLDPMGQQWLLTLVQTAQMP